MWLEANQRNTLTAHYCRSELYCWIPSFVIGSLFTKRKVLKTWWSYIRKTLFSSHTIYIYMYIYMFTYIYIYGEIGRDNISCFPFIYKVIRICRVWSPGALLSIMANLGHWPMVSKWARHHHKTRPLYSTACVVAMISSAYMLHKVCYIKCLCASTLKTTTNNSDRSLDIRSI